MRPIFGNYHIYCRQVRFRGDADNESLTSEVNSGQVEIGLINYYYYYWYRLRGRLGAGATHVITQAGPSREVYSAPSAGGQPAFPAPPSRCPAFSRIGVSRPPWDGMKCAPAGSYLMGGGEVTVLIRPERMTLAPFPHSPDGVTGTWPGGSCSPCG